MGSAESCFAKLEHSSGATQFYGHAASPESTQKRNATQSAFFGRLLVLLVTTLATVVLATGCVSSTPYEYQEPNDTGDPNTTWTILMYLCGTDLESESGLATDNLIELLDCDFDDNVTFLLETGGTHRWWNDVINPRKIERYHVTSQGLELVDQKPNTSMAVPETLVDFISWGTESYPSDRTMLLFWDHGGGSLSGVCMDELHPDQQGAYDTLTLPEIKQALQQASHKFDIIGFDTCLMASLETAETVAPWGDYLVASEETEPGGGWDYSWPAWLSRYPGMSPVELGCGICDSYYHKCENAWLADMATLSVTDLSQIPALSQAFRDASGAIVLATGNADSFRLLAQGASRAENYGGNTDAEGYTDMVDLGDLMENTSPVLGSSAEAVSAALDKAVVYSVNGANRNRAQGLSVFYPLALNKEVYDTYAQVSDNVSYLQYLAVLNGDYDAMDWAGQGAGQQENLQPLTQDDFEIRFHQEVDEDHYLRLTFDSGMNAVQSVRFELGRYDVDDSTYLPLGTDNNLVGNWGTGVFVDQFAGEWLAIDGNFLNAQLSAEAEGYNLYTVPILLNGKRSNLKVAYDYEKGAFDVLEAYDSINESNGTAGKTGRKLKDGDEISPLFTVSDIETGEGFEIELSTITWKDGMKIEDTDLGDGVYLYRYRIEDIFGNVRYSDPVFMHYEKGSIWVEEL